MRVSPSRALITNQGMRPITLLATAVVLMVGHLQLRAEPVAQNRPLPPAIAVSKSATLVERNAATELAEYLRRITGRDFPVATTDSVTGTALFAVGPGAAKAAAPDLDLSKASLGNDGIVLKTVGEAVILTGAEGAARGTLYAVYEFLEKVGGVRWWTPRAETVPTNSALAVGPLDVRYAPPILYREALATAIRPLVWESDAKEPARFAARLRFNGSFYKLPEAWGGCHATIGWCHSFFTLVPPARHFAAHPEWYSLINGERRWEKAQLCMTNEGLIEELARAALAQLRANPHTNIISIDQEDWEGHCQCPGCRAIDKAEGSAAGSLLHGINRVAERIEREAPETLVTTLAYLYSRKSPATIRPRRNVMIRLAVIERSAVQPIGHRSNALIRHDLEAWSKTADRLAIWDYSANLGDYALTLEPRFAVFGPDIRLYRDHGAISVFFEHTHGFSPVSDFGELGTWLMARLLWNPDQDDGKLVDEFLAGYYGSAAPPLREYLDLLRATVGNQKLHSFCQQEADWMPLDAMNRATDLLRRAREAVGNDAELLPRVDQAALPLDQQWLLRHADYRHEAARLGQPFLGPDDMEAGLAAFAGHCRAAGVQATGLGNRTTLDVLIGHLRANGAERSARFTLLESPVYQRFLRGEPMPLPAGLDLADAAGAIQVQENAFFTAKANLVQDEKASNHAAMAIDVPAATWSVQLRDFQDLGLVGRYRVLAEVRVITQARSGPAFIAGVYDTPARRSLAALNVPHDAPAASPHRPLEPGADLRDGNYHLYDLGTNRLATGVYPWIGVGKVDLDKVKGVYVDRFILVPSREEDAGRGPVPCPAGQKPGG